MGCSNSTLQEENQGRRKVKSATTSIPSEPAKEPDHEHIKLVIKPEEHTVNESIEEEEISPEERERRERELKEKRSQIKDKKQRPSVSAESYGRFNIQKLPSKNVKKSKDEISTLKSYIKKNFLFSSLDEKGYEIVIRALEAGTFTSGETIIQEGEEGSKLYLIDTGLVECFRINKESGFKEHLRDLGPGDIFGELALLYSSKRSATVVAKTDCKIWNLDRETFNYIIKEQQIKKRVAHEKFLRSVKILKSLSDYEIGLLCDAIKEISKEKDEIIIKQGDIANEFFLIEDGEAYITFDGRDIKNEIGRGGYFGELALLKDIKRTANVIAKTNCKLLVLDRPTFKRLLGSIEQVLDKNTSEYVVK